MPFTQSPKMDIHWTIHYLVLWNVSQFSVTMIHHKTYSTDHFWVWRYIRKDQRLLGVDDRLPRSKKVKFQESKSGVGVENCWKLKSESGVDSDFKNQLDFWFQKTLWTNEWSYFFNKIWTELDKLEKPWRKFGKFRTSNFE